MKEKTKSKRGRHKKQEPQPPKVEQTSPESSTVKGIISETDLLSKVEEVKKVVDTLPEDEKTKIDPGNQLEKDLMGLGSPPPEEATEGEPKKTESAPVQPPGVQVTDVICELENNILLSPIEYGLQLEKGFLKITDDEQRLQAAFRPDDMEIKKSAEWYWGINITLLFSKFLKWLFWNLRNKREAKRKAEALKKSQQQTTEEKTRS